MPTKLKRMVYGWDYDPEKPQPKTQRMIEGRKVAADYMTDNDITTLQISGVNYTSDELRLTAVICEAIMRVVQQCRPPFDHVQDWGVVKIREWGDKLAVNVFPRDSMLFGIKGGQKFDDLRLTTDNAHQHYQFRKAWELATRFVYDQQEKK